MSALAPLAFQPLPPGAVKPQGWLWHQLRRQADGLTGHLDEFWPDIRDSGWIGGDAEGWERAPYWLDGLIPLAFILDDERLLGKVHFWVDSILARQQPDGWLGPVQSGGYQPYDPWPLAIIGKALTQYQEASGDDRIIPALLRAMRRTQERVAERPLFDWNRTRWQDLVLTIHWLYEHTGEAWLLDLAATCHAQGYDWYGHFLDFRYTTKQAQWLQENHVVNHAMALKAPGVWWRQSGQETHRTAIHHLLAVLDQYHGQANGMFSGDESLAGRSPSQGTELCAVVEAMFSLEVLLALIGHPALGDRLEKIAYNALPATIAPDAWSHQYDQQVNQVVCRRAEQPVYTNNGPDANLFGLEPNYGCCTADMHQGWPKFVRHLVMGSPDGGLAVVAWAPCAVRTIVEGQPVRLTVATDYPFGDTVTLTVECDSAVQFPLSLRVPGWAVGPEARVNQEELSPVAGEFLNISRTWAAGDTVRLSFPMTWRARRGYNSSLSLERGPLVYALRIGEEWRQVGGELPHADWEVHPTTPWNYALDVQGERLEEQIRLTTEPVGDHPFSPQGAPLVAMVQGRRLPDWQLFQDAAAPPPLSPVTSSEPLEDLALLPYGCTNLRVTEFPVLGE